MKRWFPDELKTLVLKVNLKVSRKKYRRISFQLGTEEVFLNKILKGETQRQKS